MKIGGRKRKIPSFCHGLFGWMNDHLIITSMITQPNIRFGASSAQFSEKCHFCTFCIALKTLDLRSRQYILLYITINLAYCWSILVTLNDNNLNFCQKFYFISQCYTFMQGRGKRNSFEIIA